jgi:amidase
VAGVRPSTIQRVPDLTRQALELARLVRGGEVTARELVEASLARIEATNGAVNAFIALDGDRALAAADAIAPGDERPFCGVPIPVKDMRPVAGLPLTFGSDAWNGYVSPADGHVVTRLRDAGFVVVGVTNMPEGGILPVTEPRRYGPTRNPWNLERTPGGSSGGSAAAVAAGMTPVAHGTDGGGSIRIPAACCGLVGLKPARGRISVAPRAGDSLLSTDGPITRSVADAAAMLDVMAGPVPGDTSWAAPPAEPFAQSARREPGRLRIALTVVPPIPAPVDPVCEQAARDAAQLLESLGHEVEEVAAPPWSDDGPKMLGIFTPVFGTLIVMSMLAGARSRGAELAEGDVEALTWDLMGRIRDVDAVGYQEATLALHAIARRIVEWSSGFDAVLTPVLAERPVPIGSMPTDGPDPYSSFVRSGQFTPFTAVANITGLPGISLPLYHGADGLPTGVQLLGRPEGEGPLLALAAQLEAAQPWAERVAPCEWADA